MHWCDLSYRDKLLLVLMTMLTVPREASFTPRGSEKVDVTVKATFTKEELRKAKIMVILLDLMLCRDK